MLDMKYIRAHLDEVREAARRKRFDVDFDRLIELDDQRRTLLGEGEGLRHEQNVAGKKIAKLTGDEKQEAVEDVAKIARRVRELEESLRGVETDRDALLAQVPNPPAP